MIFGVHMLAFGGGEICEVNVPDNELNGTILDVPDNELNGTTQDLETIYHYGQNEPIYSICVGDVIEYNQKYFFVRSIGFKEMSNKDFKKYNITKNKFALDIR